MAGTSFTLSLSLVSAIFLVQKPIAPSTPGYKTSPTRADAVHLALVVLPASDAKEVEVSEEVQKFLRYTRARGGFGRPKG